jgi:MFS transporter, NNP family, nitrate/nitrite transporter
MLNFNTKQNNILHLSWLAFFFSFIAWFNMAPFNTTLIRTVGLNQEQINILMLCNVALTIPARIIIGIWVDYFGARKVFSSLLIFSSGVCFYFASGKTFEELLIARLLMGIVGAGFVVGIKMISDYFPPKQMGLAQGIYAGWGNFGAAAAVFSLPVIASFFPEEIGWRYAVIFSGILCAIWGIVYFIFAKELSRESDIFSVGFEHNLEVTTIKDLLLHVLFLIPIYGAMATLVWKLSGHPLQLLSSSSSNILLTVILVLYIFNVIQSVRSNLPKLVEINSSENKYEFKQIFILSMVYALAFGSQLAVISMFPQFLESTFELSVATAGMVGSSFAFMNLISRPVGGWISDLIDKKRALILFVIGSMIGYVIMSQINSSWPIWGVLLLAFSCSIFLQAGTGACFAAVPLIRKDLTGKVAGLTGAYGNVGAVMFLTVLSFTDPENFFSIAAFYAAIVLIALIFLNSFNNLHKSFQTN